MELNKELQLLIQESISKAIACEIKVHSDAVEKKLSDNLEVFTARLNIIDEKIGNNEKTQEIVNNKIGSIDNYINNIWKENALLKKEQDELLKRVKDSERKVEVAQSKLDDLEQYGRKTMIEINGFPRLVEEDTMKLTMDLADKLKVNLTEAEVEACHRISANEKAGIIVEFSSRKKRDEVLASRKQLGDFSIKDFGFQRNGNEGGKIYVNESLTAKRKALIREIELKKEEFRFKYIWSTKGTIIVCRDDKSRAIRINSLNDLNKLDE